MSTLTINTQDGVLCAEIAAPPMNLLGPELVHDLVALIQDVVAGHSVKVVVFTSADPAYVIAHADLTRVAAYRAEAAALTGDASLAALFRHLSASRLVTIAQIEGRVRGAGSAFVLACDLRFAAQESAIFGQFEAAFRHLPGGGGAQYLTRLLGRTHTLEVMLTADDDDADLAAWYGWINRALPADALTDFVSALAHRIAAFPDAGRAAVKARVNAISLALLEDVRRDSDLFRESVGRGETPHLIDTAMTHGLQTPDGEMDLGALLPVVVAASRDPPARSTVVLTGDAP
jgi:enoyl-CoA hydratase/carnithine racemase